MTAHAMTRITRDEAREQAKERLPEVLEAVVPGFRSERPFRCLNPDHEDRHPSMRYLSRVNAVKCFSCGWTGDTFKVVGAVYGLIGGDAFKKTYELLGIDARGGFTRVVKPAVPKHTPGGIADLLSVIYPPGWDTPEPEIKLPMPLAVIAQAETGLAGRLAVDERAIASCLKCGLAGWHFDDAELGEYFDTVRDWGDMDDYNPDFLAWLAGRAAPAHMTRRLARFIVAEGQRRKLEAAFAMAYSHLQNEEPPEIVMDGLLHDAERVTGERYKLKETHADNVRGFVDDAFDRYRNHESPMNILAGYRRSAQEFGNN